MRKKVQVNQSFCRLITMTSPQHSSRLIWFTDTGPISSKQREAASFLSTILGHKSSSNHEGNLLWTMRFIVSPFYPKGPILKDDKTGPNFIKCIVSALEVKNPSRKARDAGSVPGLWRSTGEGNGDPLQYSCLENPVDRGACRTIVHGLQRIRHNLAIKQFSQSLPLMAFDWHVL